LPWILDWLHDWILPSSLQKNFCLFLYSHEACRWIPLILIFNPSCKNTFLALHDCRPCLWWQTYS
jgi:hypothetical protein